MVAHEFFHVITPLNIHSEIIAQFNFVEPVPSEHLWLYEGTTEWAAHIMQLRGGLIDLEGYLARLTGKLRIDDNYDPDYSLSKLALTSFEPEGNQQYANIYQRGAIVPGLLDIRLLELSNGRRGLREVINELAKKYGPDRAFSEAGFFREFMEMTYPEIEDFFERYVRKAETLPLAEYYGKLGIYYIPEILTGEQVPVAGFQFVAPDGRLAVANVTPDARKFGLLDGDVIVGYNGNEVTLKTARTAFAGFAQLAAGEPYELVVDRKGEQHTLTCEKVLTERIDRHMFEVDSTATGPQITLREAWSKNL